MSLFKALYVLLQHKNNKHLEGINLRTEFRDLITEWHVSVQDNFMDWITRTINAIGITIPTRDEYWIKQALIAVRDHYAKGDKVYVRSTKRIGGRVDTTTCLHDLL